MTFNDPARVIAQSVVDDAHRKASNAMTGAVLLSIMFGALNFVLLLAVLLVVIFR